MKTSWQSARMGRLALAGLMAVTVFLSACNGGGVTGPNPNAKVATVNGAVITRGEYDKVMKMVSSNLNIDLNSISDPAQKQMLSQTISQMALNKLIFDTLVNSDAKKMGIVVSDEDVKKFKDENINNKPEVKEELKKYLSQNLMSEKDFDETLRQTILMDRFIQKKAGDQLTVSDKEVTDFYKSNPERFKIPEQIRASHILVKVIEPQMMRDMKAAEPKKSDAEIRKAVEQKKTELKAKADQLYQQVKTEPSKFAELAKVNSEDPGSAAQGGDLNYVVEQNIDPVFWHALKSTKPGQLHNGIVETQFGYHIIKVMDIKPPKSQTLAEVKPMLAEYLQSEKKQKMLMDWATKEKTQAKIEIEPEYQPKTPTPQAGGMPMTGPAASGEAPVAGGHS